MTSPMVHGWLRMPASPRPARFHCSRWPGRAGRPIPHAARPFGPSYYTGRPVLVALPQDLLVELADAGLGHGVDDLDRVGKRPPGQLRPQKFDDLSRLDHTARLRHHA